MSAVWGLRLLMFSRFVVLFDSDVTIQDMSEALWRIGNNVDPRRDTMIVDGPVDALEHASPIPQYGSKMGIDATNKWPGETTRAWGTPIAMDAAVKARIDALWQDLGL